eukprot:3281064-Pleurochrysis_carterae.AAC.1
MRCVSSSEISMGSDSRDLSLDTLSEHALILREHEVLDDLTSASSLDHADKRDHGGAFEDGKEDPEGV